MTPLASQFQMALAQRTALFSLQCKRAYSHVNILISELGLFEKKVTKTRNTCTCMICIESKLTNRIPLIQIQLKVQSVESTFSPCSPLTVTIFLYAQLRCMYDAKPSYKIQGSKLQTPTYNY